MPGQHVIPFSDKKITEEDYNDAMERSLDLNNFLAELNKPLPWYENLYDFIVYRIPYKIECFWDSIFVFIERGEKGYAKSDVWNAQIYLSELISNITRDLANETHGYPPELESAEEWELILRMISSGFAKVIEVDERGGYPTEEEQAQIDEAFDILRKYFIYLWD